MADVSKIKLPDNTTLNIKDYRIPGIDTTPTSGSSNVITSGGVYSNAVTALGTSGNNITWTKNGTTNNITVPFATTSSKLGSSTVGSTQQPIYLNNGTPTVSTPGEAYLTWGGKDFTGSYGPIDAALVGELGSNRFAFGYASGITIEYSRDGGQSWIDYGATDDEKKELLTIVAKKAFHIGKASTSEPATTDYQLRVTIKFGSGGIGLYTTLNKFIIYCTTGGSTGCWCSILGRKGSDYNNNVDVWTTLKDQIPIAGWSGYNVLNTSSATVGANDSQYRELRFIFGCSTQGSSSSGSTIYPGLNISWIAAYGGVGWNTPSNMARTGYLYTFDANQNAIFPAKVTATQFVKTGGTSSQFLKADGSVDSNTYLTSSSLSSYAPLASPALTGTPTAPTATAGTNTTQIATTAFVTNAVSNAVGSVYRVKGTKADYASLPSSGNVAGDVWNVTAAYGNYPAGTNWVWTGSEWDALGGEIDLSSKQDVLTWDTVPTENSTNPVTSGGIYQVIVDNEEVTAAALCDLDSRIVDLEANPGQVVVINVGDVSGSVPSGTFQQCYDACSAGKAVILRAGGFDYISNGYSSNTIYFSEIDVSSNTCIHASSIDIQDDDTTTQHDAQINDNVIESISVNGSTVTPISKNVDLTIPNEILTTALVGSMYRNNIGGSGTISISGTSGSFPTVPAGTYLVETTCSSTTASYTLSVNFGGQTYTLTSSGGDISDSRTLTFTSSATWSASISPTVATNSILSVKVYDINSVVTRVGKTAVSNDYNDLDNLPTIVSDVKLNGTSLTKDANNAVNVQAVTGITVNGTAQTLNNGVAAITIPAGVWSEGTGTNAAILTGSNSTAAGANSVAEGQYTQTTNPAEHAEGMYNASHTGSTTAAKTISSIGIGDSTTRSNALEVMQNGYVYLNGIGEYDGTNPTTSESLQQYLNNNEYVVATAFNDLNDRLIAVESGKQETLISGTNLKTVNGVSLLGSGNLYIEGGGGSGGVGSVKVGTTEYLPTDGVVSLPAYPSTPAAVNAQAVLVSGTNIKTINNESILGSGNITISGGSASVDSLTTSEIDTIWNNAT